MTDTPDFAQWIRAFQAGHSESFEKIYELCFPWVVHFFLNRGFPGAVAEDLAQESLLRVYTHLGEFRLEASFKTWLFQIVKSVWKNALRSQATLKRQAEQVSLDELMNPDAEERSGPFHEPRASAANPLDQALADERARLLATALEDLPPKMRECVLLRLGQDLKYREIAAVLQVSIATVKSQLSMAYKRLKPLLEPHFGAFEL